MLKFNHKILILAAGFFFLTPILAVLLYSFNTYAQDGFYHPDTSLKVTVSPIVGSLLCSPYAINVSTNYPAREVSISYNNNSTTAANSVAMKLNDKNIWEANLNLSNQPKGAVKITIKSSYPATTAGSTLYYNSLKYYFMINNEECRLKNTTVIANPISPNVETSRPAEIAATTSAPVTESPASLIQPTAQSMTKSSIGSGSSVIPVSVPIITSNVGIELPNKNIVSRENVEDLALIPAEKRGKIKIEEIKNVELKDVNKDAKKDVINFNGKAMPNTTVYLYIFSDPIIVSIKTDKDGNWEYTLDKPLEKGKHESYLVIQDEKTKEMVRGEAQNFFITKAVAKSNLLDINGNKSLTLEDPFKAIFRQYILYVASAILLAIIVLVSINFRKKRIRTIENA